MCPVSACAPMASENVDEFKTAFMALSSDVASTLQMENSLSGKGPLKLPKPRGRGKRFKGNSDPGPVPREPTEIMKSVLEECKKKRKSMSSNKAADTSDEALSKMARFTDKFNLKTYEPFLHYVPRLVNVVTVCYTTPESLPPLLTHVLCAVGGGHTGGGVWHHPATRPPPHRRALPQLLLRPQALQRRAVGIQRAAMPRLGVP